MLKVNRAVSIEKTLGTGFATLLAKDLGLTDVDLPDKPHRLKTDSTALLKLRKCFGKGRISVTPKRDGTMQVKVPGGFVILKP